MKTIIKTTLSLVLLALLSGCASNNGIDEYTLDSVNSNWYNTFKSYRNDTGTVDPEGTRSFLRSSQGTAAAPCLRRSAFHKSMSNR